MQLYPHAGSKSVETDSVVADELRDNAPSQDELAVEYTKRRSLCRNMKGKCPGAHSIIISEGVSNPKSFGVLFFQCRLDGEAFVNLALPRLQMTEARRAQIIHSFMQMRLPPLIGHDAITDARAHLKQMLKPGFRQPNRVAKLVDLESRDHIAQENLPYLSSCSSPPKIIRRSPVTRLVKSSPLTQESGLTKGSSVNRYRYPPFHSSQGPGTSLNDRRAPVFNTPKKKNSSNFAQLDSPDSSVPNPSPWKSLSTPSTDDGLPGGSLLEQLDFYGACRETGASTNSRRPTYNPRTEPAPLTFEEILYISSDEGDSDQIESSPSNRKRHRSKDCDYADRKGKRRAV